MLEEFIEFRIRVTRARLQYEKRQLEERIHLLEGLLVIIDALDEAIAIVRKSAGRSDAAERLRKRFKLSEVQSFYVVDLRIYQLASTAIIEVKGELSDKLKLVKAIEKILKSALLLKKEVSVDLQRISDEYGDTRRCQLVYDLDEPEFSEEEYIEHENVYAIVTADGWLKRIKTSSDPANTRVRDGDSLFFVEEVSTQDSLAIFTNLGNLYTQKVYDLSSTSGYGEPIQKIFRFQDGERIVSCIRIASLPKGGKLLFYTEKGMGFFHNAEIVGDTTKRGKRLAKLKPEDSVVGVLPAPEKGKKILFISEAGYGLLLSVKEIPTLSSAGKGVILHKLPESDRVVVACSVQTKATIPLLMENGKKKETSLSKLSVSSRAKRGTKLYARGGKVVGLYKEQLV